MKKEKMHGKISCYIKSYFVMIGDDVLYSYLGSSLSDNLT